MLANPPFGGKERKEVQQNFPIRTGETAFLFLQHFIKLLKAGGRGGVVIKNTFLSNTDNASVSLRKLLLESCNLHTVLDCPGGTFQGAGVKTVVLFFEKGAPTRKTWYYQLDPGRNMGKTNPLNDDDLTEFVKLQKKFADSDKSWTVDAKDIDPTTFDLSVKNPNGGEEVVHRSPQEIMDEIAALDGESAEVLTTIRGLLLARPQLDARHRLVGETQRRYTSRQSSHWPWECRRRQRQRIGVGPHSPNLLGWSQGIHPAEDIQSIGTERFRGSESRTRKSITEGALRIRCKRPTNSA